MRVSPVLGRLLLFSSMLWAAGLPAATNGFFAPSFRGSANSQVGYWEVFTDAVGTPGNQPDAAGATTDATLTQIDTNAFLTGSGNIYSPGGTNTFELSDAVPFTLGTVVLQTRTVGSELDYGAVFLTYTDGNGQHSIAPLPRVELNRGSQPGLGATVSSLWQWDLRGLDVDAYVIFFRAAGTSLSFDSMTVDTWDQFTPLFTPPFQINSTTPAIERWMYANNFEPCNRVAGSSFGTFGDDSGVDTRHSQHLVGWDTATQITTNAGPSRYLIRRCRLTLTINRGNLFVYDPTQDGYRTYFETNHPSFLPDTDPGRPVELFGAAFRNGYSTASFDQCAPFGSNAAGERNGYVAGFSTNGAVVDIGNNVGKTNVAYPRFEVAPFAVGQTTNVAPGQLVPVAAKITFDLNLSDPLVLSYVQSGLHSGLLRFMVSSLHETSGQFGAPSYPDFVTHFNEALANPTRFEIEGLAVSNSDVDADGLPDDWELWYLRSLTHNSSADPDGDGATNLAEFRAGTDPAQAASVLRLLSPASSGNGTILRFQHAASHRYTAEFTEDFQTWTALTNGPTYLLGTNQVEWRDGTTTLNRFYRITAISTHP